MPDSFFTGVANVLPGDYFYRYVDVFYRYVDVRNDGSLQGKTGSVALPVGNALAGGSDRPGG